MFEAGVSSKIKFSDLSAYVGCLELCEVRIGGTNVVSVEDEVNVSQVDDCCF